MKLFDRIKGYLFSYLLSDPRTLEILGGAPSGTGIHVNDITTLGIPAFYKAKKLIGDWCGKIPCPVYTVGANNSRNKAYNHPAFKLLNDRANEYQSSIDLRAKLLSDACGHGNGWAAIVRNKNTGLAESLHGLDPQCTWIEYRTQTGEIVPDTIVVRTTIRGEVITMPYADCIHIKGLGDWNGMLGEPLTFVAREFLGLGLATIHYGSYFFGNNGQPGIVIEAPGMLNETQQLQLKEQLKQEHGGTRNAGKTLILTGGLKMNTPAIDLRKQQWAETMEAITIGVANLTGIPPHKLGANISTSYASLEQENIAFLQDCLDAWLCKAESEYHTKLLTEAEKRSGRYFIEHQREAITRNDTAAETDSLIKEVQAGLLTVNEVRALKNRPTIGEQGDRFQIGTNFTYTDMPTFDPDAQEPEEPQGEPDDNTDDESDDKLKALSASVCERYFKRLDKCLANKRGEKFRDYLDTGFIADHFAVLVETLKPVAGDRAIDIATRTLDSLKEELYAVLQEQVGESLQRHLETLKEEISL